MSAVERKTEAYNNAINQQKRMPAPGEFPPETQRREEGVGLQTEMAAQPVSSFTSKESHMVNEMPALGDYKPSGRLQGRKALITGGDSGIGRSVALFFAKEGADVAIAYLPVEQQDAEDTRKLISQEVGLRSKEETKKAGADTGALCELLPIDLQTEESCKEIIDKTVSQLGGIDLLVNNAAFQMTCENVEELSAGQVEKTFRVNVFAPIYLVKHAVPHMKEGGSILFSTSVVAYKGNSHLVDYAATKSAMVGLVRSLAMQLAPRGIRVNGVAPGPVWTPLQPISRTEEDMEKFGEKKPTLGRIAQPSEIAPSYVFLASNDANQYTGQVLHPNCGCIVGS
eukprot:TRINITY_DN2280_c0_g1_i2.p1 TRINITY_DN2280_c0_g1~~TRINITY_DN2280_c0_g1_i2.p1  ORF type:complete len:340 (+),score=57.59 TRINITY_DN2280_c0_g1_i2:1693-2712(+)